MHKLLVFGIWDLGFRQKILIIIWDLGFGISAFGISAFGISAKNTNYNLGFGIWDFGIWDFGIWILNLGGRHNLGLKPVKSESSDSNVGREDEDEEEKDEEGRELGRKEGWFFLLNN
ncbi:hypothetical protein Glove_221g96 [Diversispora epigaea]|uniref:Uncharacterized protein n=1 Tax=Diversispora epigaea TaxID=1348612 RepID=A0A397IF75_9GLOM|nr:hypothetical protein Glove_221g96 [Diversispora epigaea]